MALAVLLNISMTNFLMLWKKNIDLLWREQCDKLVILKSFENFKYMSLWREIIPTLKI